MAFAQKHRRPHLSSPPQEEQEYPLGIAEEYPTLQANRVLTANRSQVVWSSSSDTESDWHVVGQTQSLISRPRQNSVSPLDEPSEAESWVSSRLSDCDSYIDNESHNEMDSTLPYHDGTGAFIEGTGLSSDSDAYNESDSRTPLRRSVRQTPLTMQAQLQDFEPESDSMPNILLPNGGIPPPTFVRNAVSPTQQKCHVSRNNSQRTLVQLPRSTAHDQRGVAMTDTDDDDIDASEMKDILENTTHTQSLVPLRATRRRKRNLDSIPTHHPDLRGSEILYMIGHHLRRLATHWVENDTSVLESFGTHMSEGAREGCLPFGSHIHMGFEVTGLS